jgi:hypothetical protein
MLAGIVLTGEQIRARRKYLLEHGSAFAGSDAEYETGTGEDIQTPFITSPTPGGADSPGGMGSVSLMSYDSTATMGVRRPPVTKVQSLLHRAGFVSVILQLIRMVDPWAIYGVYNDTVVSLISRNITCIGLYAASATLLFVLSVAYELLGKTLPRKRRVGLLTICMLCFVIGNGTYLCRLFTNSAFIVEDIFLAYLCVAEMLIAWLIHRGVKSLKFRVYEARFVGFVTSGRDEFHYAYDDEKHDQDRVTMKGGVHSDKSPYGQRPSEEAMYITPDVEVTPEVMEALRRLTVLQVIAFVVVFLCVVCQLGAIAANLGRDYTISDPDSFDFAEPGFVCMQTLWCMVMLWYSWLSPCVDVIWHDPDSAIQFNDDKAIQAYSHAALSNHSLRYEEEFHDDSHNAQFHSTSPVAQPTTHSLYS